MEAKRFNSKALQEFAGLMIEKIEQVDLDWQKPWIVSPVGQPCNAISGRPYNGLNDLMLLFHAEKKGYKIPAYLTYKQAIDAGAYVRKNEKSIPIMYWGKYYVEKDHPENIIKSEEYNKLNEYEKEKYRQKVALKDYAVFNVQQTNIPEEKPELWKKIQQGFVTCRYNDENGMFKSVDMDRMLENQAWLCPVNVKESNKAFYAPRMDEITVPLKVQFKDGESFYTTLLHEMGHSTGTGGRLDRDQHGFFGDEKYAKEELVAELTAALTGAELGITSCIREENAQYLKSWLETLKAEPNFILTVLSDVHKASNMICDVVRKEQEQVKEFESEQATKGKEQVKGKEEQLAVKTTDNEKIADAFQLEKGQLYRYTVDNRTVMFAGLATGGYYNFQYPDSGYEFQLMGGDKMLKNIRSLDGDAGMNLSVKEANKTEKKQLAAGKFMKSEIPKGELKLLGLKLSDLSATDTKNLLSGKETKTLLLKNQKGDRMNATLTLHRNSNNTVSITMKPVKSANTHKIKMS
ncbi:MAG: ssDNA-binding domain-containing protein [Dysgonamonadaceae bacterium]|jgi:antirestriction protein ArdC|nr:ssDNA-binding domain-containing protein [Dysgonamonadaceae bacterium]